MPFGALGTGGKRRRARRERLGGGGAWAAGTRARLRPDAQPLPEAPLAGLAADRRANGRDALGRGRGDCARAALGASVQRLAMGMIRLGRLVERVAEHIVDQAHEATERL